jgi:riboflavin synthase
MQTWLRHAEKLTRKTYLSIGLVWASVCLLLIALVWFAASVKIDRDEQQLIEKLRLDTEQRARNHAEQLLRRLISSRFLLSINGNSTAYRMISKSSSDAACTKSRCFRSRLMLMVMRLRLRVI